MGRHIARIGDYWAEYGDWSWDYVKQGQPKEYYDNETIEVDVKNVITKREYVYNVPIEELVDVYKKKTLYHWRWNDDKTLTRWLFNKQPKPLKGIVTLKTRNKDFYLASSICDKDITITPHPYIHHINNYQQLQWVYDNDMYVDWDIADCEE